MSMPTLEKMAHPTISVKGMENGRGIGIEIFQFQKIKNELLCSKPI